MEQKHPLQVLRDSAPTLMKIAGIVTNKPSEELEGLIAGELGFLQQRFELSSALRECTPESLLNCVRQSVKDNLTLNPTAGLVYIYPQNINAGTREKPSWVKVAAYEPSPDGRISTARQTGRILDLTRPKVEKDAAGKVIGGSVSLLKDSYPEPRWELYEFDQSDITRWAKFSAKKNRGTANALYTSELGGPDPEFMRAKIVKHSLKKLGTNANEVKKINQVKIEPMFSASTNEAAVLESLPAGEEWEDNM